MFLGWHSQHYRLLYCVGRRHRDTTYAAYTDRRGQFAEPWSIESRTAGSCTGLSQSPGDAGDRNKLDNFFSKWITMCNRIWLAWRDTGYVEIQSHNTKKEPSLNSCHHLRETTIISAAGR